MVKVNIIVGSTRPNRGGIHVARWLMRLTAEHPEVTWELVDLKEVNLPLLDEPDLPSRGNYTKDHTKKWSAIVNGADGFVWVHPEYNHSVSAALKNALDFLWVEWHYKPVAFVSYGAEAGGSRAAEVLRGTAAGLKMFDLRDQVVLSNYQQYLAEDGTFTPGPLQIKAAHSMLKELAFWAAQLQLARAAHAKTMH